MRIAVCDDDQGSIDTIIHYIEQWAQTKGSPERPEAFGFTSAESFLYHWSPDTNFDLLFLDIAFDTMSG